MSQNAVHQRSSSSVDAVTEPENSVSSTRRRLGHQASASVSESSTLLSSTSTNVIQSTPLQILEAPIKIGSIDKKDQEEMELKEMRSTDQLKIRNPISWFGVLVPPALKTSQFYFKQG